MDVAYERPASSSSYFARPPPASRLLLRVYSAEGLRHVSSHGTYCKIYVGSTDMVRGSGAFARRTPKLSGSSSSHSLVGLLASRSNTAQPPSTPLPPTSSSEGDLGNTGGKMRVLKTQVQKEKSANPVWNEKFDIPVLDPVEDVLSIRVKSARLMSSPAIGACSIPLKYLTVQGASTVDRWVDLKRGKKEAGRLRLQLRLVDPSVTRIQNRQPQDDQERPSRPRNHQNSDTHLSLPTEDEAFKKTRRRDHKYHRSARRFDGTLLKTSSSRSFEGKKSDSSDEKLPSTPTTRDNSASATSNESIDDSEPASEASVSPSVSPSSKRASIEDADTFSDSETTPAVTKAPSISIEHTSETSTASTTSPPVAAMGLDASYAHRGTMRFSELERSRMKMAEISRAANAEVPRETDNDDDLGEDDNRRTSTRRWTDNHTQLSVLSSTMDSRDSRYSRESSQLNNTQLSVLSSTLDSHDSRESSRVNNTQLSVLSSTLDSRDSRDSSRVYFDEDDYGDADLQGKRKPSLSQGAKRWGASGTLSSTATSTIDARDSSRVHTNFSDSDSDGDDDDEASSEKSREQQRQQWQMQQRKMQLREVEEVDSESASESESEDVDEFDDELELETPRMQITPTLANLLSRQSMNVLFDEEEDTDDELEALKMSDEFVPILEATSPASIDSIDSALRESSFD
ncbi:hypothetical protein PHYBOEH_009773 [Phytophthora boehmeriae]|uniref:C2 domain-containing protein n=1 Tax=Phytophthora boehmeriae TaxID=109152 RepID=A0A8T1X4U9_9STRA|nr:hypothetical protein PHYBOEH_009773 [Phytophthora boehmeriae]